MENISSVGRPLGDPSLSDSQLRSVPTQASTIPVYLGDSAQFHSKPTTICKVGKILVVSEEGGQVNFLDISGNPYHPVLKGKSTLPNPVYSSLVIQLNDARVLFFGHLNKFSLWSTTPMNEMGTYNIPGKAKLAVQLREKVIVAVNNELHIYQFSQSDPGQGTFQFVPFRVLSAHSGVITGIVTDRDRNLMFTVCTQAELRVWDMMTLTCKFTSSFAKEKSPLVGIGYNAHQYFIAHENGTIREIIFQVSEGRGRLDEGRVLSSTNGGKITTLLCNDKSLVLVGRDSGQIDVIDGHDMRLNFSIAETRAHIEALFVTSGTLYAACGDPLKALQSWARRDSLDKDSSFSTQTKDRTVGNSVATLLEKELGVYETAVGSAGVKIESNGAETIFRIDPMVRQIDPDGQIIFEGPMVELAASFSSIAKMNSGSEEMANANAQEALRLLTFSFKKIPNHETTPENWYLPTHQWEDDRARNRFKNLLGDLCIAAGRSLRKDETLINVNSPAYILGDIHGSYRDLAYFARSLWTLGVDFTPSKYLFLGDYVDRGPHQIEVISYLLALRVLYPKQVILLRGNHEFPDQNAQRDEKSGAFQPDRFVVACYSFCDKNEKEAIALWETYNAAFELMPLAAIVDQKLFCCHGGIPRTIENRTDILQAIRTLKRPLKIQDFQANTFLIQDLMWADPAPPEAEPCQFVPNPPRGDGNSMFGQSALEKFFALTGCTMLVRAHQKRDLGFHVSKNSKCLTVFSSSHYCGNHNSAAVVFVHNKKVKVAVTHHKSIITEPSAPGYTEVDMML